MASTSSDQAAAAKAASDAATAAAQKAAALQAAQAAQQAAAQKAAAAQAAQVSATNKYGLTAAQWQQYQTWNAGWKNDSFKMAPTYWMWANNVNGRGGANIPTDQYNAAYDGQGFAPATTSAEVATAQAVLAQQNAALAQAQAQAKAAQDAAAAAQAKAASLAASLASSKSTPTPKVTTPAPAPAAAKPVTPTQQPNKPAVAPPAAKPTTTAAPPPAAKAAAAPAAPAYDVNKDPAAVNKYGMTPTQWNQYQQYEAGWGDKDWAKESPDTYMWKNHLGEYGQWQHATANGTGGSSYVSGGFVADLTATQKVSAAAQADAVRIRNVDPQKTAGYTFEHALNDEWTKVYHDAQKSNPSLTEYQFRQQNLGANVGGRFLDTVVVKSASGYVAPIVQGSGNDSNDKTAGHNLTKTTTSGQTVDAKTGAPVVTKPAAPAAAKPVTKPQTTSEKLTALSKQQETNKATVIHNSPTTSTLLTKGNSELAKLNRVKEAQADAHIGQVQLKDGTWINQYEKIGASTPNTSKPVIGTAGVSKEELDKQYAQKLAGTYHPTHDTITDPDMYQKVQQQKAEAAAFQAQRSQVVPLLSKSGGVINQITDKNGGAINSAHNELGQAVTISTPTNESLASKAKTESVYKSLVSSGKTSAGQATTQQTDKSGNAANYYTRGSDWTAKDQTEANQRRNPVVQAPKSVVQAPKEEDNSVTGYLLGGAEKILSNTGKVIISDAGNLIGKINPLNFVGTASAKSELTTNNSPSFVDTIGKVMVKTGSEIYAAADNEINGNGLISRGTQSLFWGFTPSQLSSEVGKSYGGLLTAFGERGSPASQQAILTSQNKEIKRLQQEVDDAKAAKKPQWVINMLQTSLDNQKSVTKNLSQAGVEVNVAKANSWLTKNVVDKVLPATDSSLFRDTSNAIHGANEFVLSKEVAADKNATGLKSNVLGTLITAQKALDPYNVFGNPNPTPSGKLTITNTTPKSTPEEIASALGSVSKDVYSFVREKPVDTAVALGSMAVGAEVLGAVFGGVDVGLGAGGEMASGAVGKAFETSMERGVVGKIATVAGEDATRAIGTIATKLPSMGATAIRGSITGGFETDLVSGGVDSLYGKGTSKNVIQSTIGGATSGYESGGIGGAAKGGITGLETATSQANSNTKNWADAIGYVGNLALMKPFFEKGDQGVKDYFDRSKIGEIGLPKTITSKNVELTEINGRSVGSYVSGKKITTDVLNGEKLGGTVSYVETPGIEIKRSPTIDATIKNARATIGDYYAKAPTPVTPLGAVSGVVGKVADITGKATGIINTKTVVISEQPFHPLATRGEVLDTLNKVNDPVALAKSLGVVSKPELEINPKIQLSKNIVGSDKISGSLSDQAHDLAYHGISKSDYKNNSGKYTDNYKKPISHVLEQMGIDPTKINIKVVSDAKFAKSSETTAGYTDITHDDATNKVGVTVVVPESADLAVVAHEIGHVITKNGSISSDLLTKREGVPNFTLTNTKSKLMSPLHEANAEVFKNTFLNAYEKTFDTPGIDKYNYSLAKNIGIGLESPAHGIGYTLAKTGLIKNTVQPEYLIGEKPLNSALGGEKDFSDISVGGARGTHVNKLVAEVIGNPIGIDTAKVPIPRIVTSSGMDETINPTVRIPFTDKTVSSSVKIPLTSKRVGLTFDTRQYATGTIPRSIMGSMPESVTDNITSLVGSKLSRGVDTSISSTSKSIVEALKESGKSDLSDGIASKLNDIAATLKTDLQSDKISSSNAINKTKSSIRELKKYVKSLDIDTEVKKDIISKLKSLNNKVTDVGNVGTAINAVTANKQQYLTRSYADTGRTGGENEYGFGGKGQYTTLQANDYYNEVGGYFTQKGGGSSLSNEVHLLTSRPVNSTLSPELIKSEANQMEKLGYIKPTTYKELGKTAVETSKNLSEPIVIPSPKLASGHAKPESEVLHIFGDTRSTEITGRQFAGFTESGNPIFKVRMGDQPKLTGSVLGNIVENAKYNWSNALSGKGEYVKGMAQRANRRAAELKGTATSRPQEFAIGYSTNPVEHTNSVEDYMGQIWDSTPQYQSKYTRPEFIIAGRMHDNMRISETETEPIAHDKAMAQAMKRGLVNDKEFNSLSKQQQLNVANAIGVHTDILPPTLENIAKDASNAKYLVRRPNDFQKALANADRLSRSAEQAKKQGISVDEAIRRGKLFDLPTNEKSDVGKLIKGAQPEKGFLSPSRLIEAGTATVDELTSRIKGESEVSRKVSGINESEKTKKAKGDYVKDRKTEKSYADVYVKDRKAEKSYADMLGRKSESDYGLVRSDKKGYGSISKAPQDIGYSTKPDISGGYKKGWNSDLNDYLGGRNKFPKWDSSLEYTPNDKQNPYVSPVTPPKYVPPTTNDYTPDKYTPSTTPYTPSTTPYTPPVTPPYTPPPTTPPYTPPPTSPPYTPPTPPPYTPPPVTPPYTPPITPPPPPPSSSYQNNGRKSGIIVPPPPKQIKKKDDTRSRLLKSETMSRDKLMSTTKVATYDEMIRGGLTQGAVGEGSFGNKKPIPTMISAGARSRNASGMISLGKPSVGSMIQKSNKNPFDMISSTKKPAKSKPNGKKV